MDFDMIGAIVQSLGIDPADGLQINGGGQLASQHHPQIEPTLPLLLVNLQGTSLSSSQGNDASADSKLNDSGLLKALLNCYPTTHEVILLWGADAQSIKQISITLAELPTIAIDDASSCLFVPSLGAGGSFTALLDIVAHLRAPDGCPWDQEQTLESLRHDLLDEATEVLEAIDAEADGSDNTRHIVEELGDLLLLPAMMTQIAIDDGRFKMADVTRGIVEKLIRRHPHVFGDANTDDVDEIVVNWDAIKAQEKAERGEKPRGPLDGVPASLPALEKARKLQSKAKKAGMLNRTELASSSIARWTDLTNEIDAGQLTETTLGAFLWSLVALADESDLNTENALRSYTVGYRRNASK